MTDRLFPKERLDSLVDGVFAFAMTLLVVNVELPDDFKPHNAAELAQELFNRSDTFFAYVITFVVLASFWIWRVRGNDLPAVSRPFVWIVLAHLFFVTLMPFSMLVIGRYDFAPAIWAYSGNMIFLALTAIGIGLVSTRDAGRQFLPSDVSGYVLLTASAILSIMIAEFNVNYAMFAYLINLASPILAKRKAADRAPSA